MPGSQNQELPVLQRLALKARFSAVHRSSPSIGKDEDPEAKVYKPGQRAQRQGSKGKTSIGTKQGFQGQSFQGHTCQSDCPGNAQKGMSIDGWNDTNLRACQVRSVLRGVKRMLFLDFD
eukprot:182554-Pelagomonas_calceolata.AAC.3